MFPVKVQWSRVYIAIVKARANERVSDFWTRAWSIVFVSLTFDESENSTSEIALHMGEKIRFPQNGKLNMLTGISDTTEVENCLQCTLDKLPSGLNSLVLHPMPVEI